jgi:hypothetical protein
MRTKRNIAPIPHPGVSVGTKVLVRTDTPPVTLGWGIGVSVGFCEGKSLVSILTIQSYHISFSKRYLEPCPPI